MTTIFADAKQGIMVCDSMVSNGEQWWADPDKVIRIGDELIGFAGVAAEADRWLAWYKAGQNGPMPKVSGSCALILGPGGLRVLDSNGMYVPVARGFMGTGSGGGYATAAFMAGADAETAVYIATQIDPSSGGDVIVHALAESLPGAK
jgi:ATP-dependent protease HslVU (ClpYQ) peptidase subunit